MKRGPPHDDQTGNADPSVSAPSHGGLGDLISDRTLGFWGSAGSASGFSPIERVLLSANGNLQRLVSSYLNSHVSVTVKHSTKKSHGVYEREVALLAQGQEFGVATSTVTLSRDDCIDAVDRRGVAIGQMFRHLNIMPRFTLHRFGEQADGRIWREYTLEGSGVCCRILEQLSRAIFELPPPAAAPPPAAPPPAATDAAAPAAAAPAAAAPVGTFGDIMSANTTGIELPSGFTGMQRLLLTANGNVERIVRAYYDEEVHMSVLESSRRAPGVYERKVVMHARGEEIMQARSMVYITDEAWLDATERQQVDVSEMFHHMGVLPTFTLHSAGLCPGATPTHFWRVYSMKTAGMTCEITETFVADVLDRPPKAVKPAKRSSLDHNGF